MTVSNESSRTSAVGTGAEQVVPFTFPITNNSDIVVTSRVITTGVETTMTETTDYTVVNNGESGGSITTVTPFIANTMQIHIVRNTPNTQLLDLEQGGAFNAENVEDAFDKNAKLTIENVDGLNRTLKFPTTDPASSFADMPNSVDRASKQLGFDSAGKPTAIEAVPEGSVAFSTIGENIAGAANAQAERALLELDTTDPVEFAAITGTTGTFTSTVTTPSYISDNIQVKGPWVDVTHPDFAATGDGSTDDTAAVQAAIDYVEALPRGGIVFLPVGIYKTTSTLTVQANNVFLVGQGKQTTRILFAPTASDTCLEVRNGASAITYGGIKDLQIFSADNTYVKVGIDIYDVSLYDINNVVINGSVVKGSTQYWGDSTDSSIGLRTNGRDSTSIKGLSSFSDIPLVIGVNPNSGIDIDHFHFQDLYLIAFANPCVTIADGVDLNNVTFDGYQAWVLGTYGLYWSDTTTSSVARNLNISNVRLEQETSATSYIIYIDHNTNLYGLNISNVGGGLTAKGYYLRNTVSPIIQGSLYVNASNNEAINVDATVQGLSLVNDFWQTGTTATLTGQTLRFGIQQLTGPVPSTAYYEASATSIRSDVALSGSTITLADDASETDICDTQFVGMLVVSSSTDVSAIIAIKGGTSGAVIVSDWASAFAITDTDAKVCVFFTGGAYVLKNRLGTQQNFTITQLGGIL